MKKIVFCVLTIGTILSISACQKEEARSYRFDGKEVHMAIEAIQSTTTKTSLSGTSTKWKEGDMVTVMYKNTSSEDWQTAPSGAASSSNEYASATFSVTLTSPDASKDAYALYPKNSISQTSASSAKIPIAATQHPTGTSFDGASDILISKPFKPTSGTVSTQFSRLGAVLKIKINNAELNSEKLQRLSVTGPSELAGNVIVSLSDGSSHSSVEGIENGSNTVIAEYAAGDQFTIGSSSCVYLVVKPQTLASGSHLIINGTTTNYSFTKDITLENDIHLNAGHIIPLNITISSIQQMPTDRTGWYRVESASWLFAGDRVMIANSAGTKGMSKAHKSGNRDAVDISVAPTADSKYQELTYNDNYQIFILDPGTVSNSFAFWCDNGGDVNQYICAASSTKNELSTTNSNLINGDCSFIPSLSSGSGSLIAQGDFLRNVLRCYSTSTFNCYDSEKYNAISIYKYYGDYNESTFRLDKVAGLKSHNLPVPSSGSGQNLTEGTEYESGIVKMTITLGTNNNKTRIYNGASGLYLGVYQSGDKTPGTLTFDVGIGKHITQIDFTASSFSMTASVGSLSEKSWTGESQQVTFTASGANNITLIRIKYADD